ncbi:hypothetical protein IEQ34_004917 [Dendrobium chrysotoxum]|uniref:Uncharacterized protein n=1 Tax=Dendrobium chrysotoxum TaxID=161865 RepID=A0AAV7H9K6_DENCH|nr:hypothetical protein IEQ34_004917 [Dendrobium chrysotoxum]
MYVPGLRPDPTRRGNSAFHVSRPAPPPEPYTSEQLHEKCDYSYGGNCACGTGGGGALGGEDKGGD